jgi:hypothetical protein
VGNIIDVDKYSYAPGASLNAQVKSAIAIYNALAAKQLVRAADHGLDAQKQESVFAAPTGILSSCSRNRPSPSAGIPEDFRRLPAANRASRRRWTGV